MLVVIVSLISFSANAFDLNGAWTTDESNCAKVFVMKDKKLSADGQLLTLTYEQIASVDVE
jgi:hypothetical protein